MNHGTQHILKQVEWYYKLRNDYNCSIVEMEKEVLINNNFRMIADVYGKTEDNKIFIVEIGHINGNEKLMNLLESAENEEIKFIHVTLRT
jgi:hypothetical protein